MTKKLGNYKGNDVELCTSTSTKVVDQTVVALMENQVPFTKVKKNIPFYKRLKNGSHKFVWVISTSPRQYGNARRVIDSMDMFCRERLVLSNY